MANELNMTLFSKRLKEARTDKNMTQKELSEKSGVSTVMISAYERSNTNSGKNPALNNIYAIATALGVSIDWLCGIDKEQESTEGINTTTLLKSLINILDTLKYYIEELPNKGINGKSNYYDSLICIHLSKNENNKKKIGNFVDDYLEVKKLIDNGALPKDIKQTVIYAIIEKYKNISIEQLINHYEDDDLPF